MLLGIHLTSFLQIFTKVKSLTFQKKFSFLIHEAIWNNRFYWAVSHRYSILKGQWFHTGMMSHDYPNAVCILVVKINIEFIIA